MKLRLEIFILLILLVIFIIMLGLKNVKSGAKSFIIYLIGVFLLLAFIIIYLIGNKISKEHLQVYYNPINKIYTSSNMYNTGNCTIDNSCIIKPDYNNLFPKDLENLANKSFYKCGKVYKPMDVPNCKKPNPCKSINRNCCNENMYPTITPNLPKNVLTKGQCAICKIPINQSIEYFSNSNCSYDNTNNCKSICRGCKTGYCNDGWCFGNK